MPKSTTLKPTTRRDALPDDVAARGQRIVLLLAERGRSISAHISERLGNPELAANVPILILCQLSIHGSVRPRDLLAPTHLTSGALTKHLDRLEQLGLISRAFGTVQGDRRGSVVSLTEEGRRAAATIDLAVEERLEELRTLHEDLGRLLGA